MALSEKARAKGVASALKVLPPGTNVRAYAVGRGHLRATTPAIIVGAVFVVVFVGALLLGQIIFPGVLLFLIVYGEVLPPRSILITDQGLAVMGRSMWNGRPTKIVHLLPPGPVYAPNPTGSVTLALGTERVTLSRGEFDRLAAAASAG